MITDDVASIERMFDRELVLQTPVTKPFISRSAIVLSLQLSTSIFFPLVLLLIYQDYAASNGIVLETGCEGPGIPFSVMSGILFALQLRFSLPKKDAVR